jgi:hypothetical protein
MENEKNPATLSYEQAWHLLRGIMDKLQVSIDEPTITDYAKDDGPVYEEQPNGKDT